MNKKLKNLTYDNYELIWQEDFEGNELNRQDWNVELHEPGWVNKELQEYVDSEENIRVSDSKLILMPVQTQRSDGSYYYTSGRVNTQGKHDFMYGLVEARAKVPAGKGYLPAFWMMPLEEDFYGQWPKCGEIDCMEVIGDQLSTVHGTIHYGEPHEQCQGHYELEEGGFDQDFHLFSCEWQPDTIKWYVDGHLYHEAKDWFSAWPGEDKKPYPAPFNQPFHVILNLAVGGEWVGYPDDKTFEAKPFEIDYVKIYKVKE